MLFLKKKNSQFLFFIFYLFIFLIGLFLFKDFGVYNDEAFYRVVGFNYYNNFKEIILHSNFENIYNSEIVRFSEHKNLKVWTSLPIFFDLLTEFVADILNFDDTKNIFELRHFINFLFFFISLIFFFKIILHRYKNKYLAYISVVFLFFTPRIFAESFYNSKDLLFLSLSIINIYFSQKFISHKSSKILFVYSISTGILILTRIMGLIFPIVTFSIILFQFAENKKFFLINLKKILFSSIIIVIVVYSFWPFLWSAPISNFIIFIKYVKSLDVYTNLYFDEYILSNKTPWHFKYVWISITTPLTLLCLFLFGLCFNLIKFLNRLLLLERNNIIWFNHYERLDFQILILLITPLILLLASKNSFDGWRHIYYIYPLMIYHVIYLINKTQILSKKLFITVVFISLLNTFLTVSWMIVNHPFQYAYFNILKKIINKKFDLDYMALSLKNSLEYILSNDPKKKIKISAMGEVWLEGAISYLSKSLRDRLEISSFVTSDYVIDTLRPKINKNSVDLTNFSKFHTLSVDGNNLNIIYKKISK